MDSRLWMFLKFSTRSKAPSELRSFLKLNSMRFLVLSSISSTLLWKVCMAVAHVSLYLLSKMS